MSISAAPGVSSHLFIAGSALLEHWQGHRRFQETMTAFGQYPGKVYDRILYAIDNEIHHRGQGYVCLRALGVEPPAFYERV